MTIALPILSADLNEDSQAPPAAPAQADRPGQMFDSHGRVIHDLRLSVTDRCNYRCRYCMDPDYSYMPKMELLSLQEYLTVVRVCLNLGITKIRVTGGEPTLYPELMPLLEALGDMPIKDIAMTTNGSLMTQQRARAWRQAGLHRITLSLDSLRDDRIAHITRAKTGLQSTINAIRIAQEVGLTPIKVNAVIMRGVNDDELADFADFAREHEIDMRLIEFMPLDSGRAWDRSAVISADEMLDAIDARHELVELEKNDPHSPSLNFGFADGAPGHIGIIASVTRPFCGACSRLRVTADGKVRPCLFSLKEWDLRPLLRSGASDEELAAFVVDVVWTKQKGHAINAAGFVQPERTMSAIGG